MKELNEVPSVRCFTGSISDVRIVWPFRTTIQIRANHVAALGEHTRDKLCLSPMFFPLVMDMYRASDTLARRVILEEVDVYAPNHSSHDHNKQSVDDPGGH